MASILIVEDDITLSLAIEENLEEMGYEVAGVAFTGHSKIEIIERAKAIDPYLTITSLCCRSIKRVVLLGWYADR